VASTAFSTLSGAAIGAAVGSIQGQSQLGLFIGECVGLAIGLLLFSTAVAVPFGLRDFVLWCLASVLYPQACLAVPTAACLVMIERGIQPVVAILLALLVVYPTFAVIVIMLLPSRRLAPRLVSGPVLENYERLERESKRRLRRLSRATPAAHVWRRAIARHLARWKAR
jgi:hypothetical protein